MKQKLNVGVVVTLSGRCPENSRTDGLKNMEGGLKDHCLRAECSDLKSS